MDISGLTSGSAYNSKASNNKGLSGLASGMDTEGMVEAMLANTQSKIDKQNSTKTQTEWKQEIYRSIITQINSFQKKFFNPSSSTSLLNQAFFNAMSAASKSNAFKVTATSSAAAGKTKLEVQQLATNTSHTSADAVSGKLGGEFDKVALDKMLEDQIKGNYKLSVKVGSDTVDVDLKDVFVKTENGKDTLVNYTSAQAQTDAVTAKLNDALKGKGVTASIENGNLSLTGTDGSKPISVNKTSGKQALQRLGLTAGAVSQAGAGKTTVLSSKTDLTASIDFQLTLDDQTKDIQLDMSKLMDADGKLDYTKLKTEMQTRVDSAFGKDQIVVKMKADGTGFELKPPTAGRKLMIGGDLAVLDAIGMKNGQSNRIGLGGELKDLYFGEKLQGGSFRFSINGVNFNFSENNTMGEVINAVNASDAGVRIIYKTQEDKFVIQSSETGAGREIKMEQTEGNLLTSMFGVESSKTFASDSLHIPSIGGDVAWEGEDDGGVKKYTGGSFKLNVNGTDYTFKLKKDKKYTQEEMVSELNASFDKQFGAGNVKLSVENGKSTIDAKPGMVVTIPKTTIDAAKGETIESLSKAGNIALALGFGENGASNAVTDDTTLGQLGLGSGIAGADANTKLGDLKSLTGGAVEFRDGKLVVTGLTSIGSEADMMRLFGVKALTPGKTGNAAVVEAGKNAKIKVDGVETERSSNNFTINGMNIELTGVSEAGKPDEIEVSRNTDSIVEGVKGFIDEYNKLIKTVNDLLTEETNYKKYPPLTEAQKKEMSEKEIALWEEKSKQGLMRNDSTLSGFVQAMRSMIYEKPAGSSIAIYDLGIDTGNWESKGQLVFTSDGEAQLRKMIESDASAVMNLFTDEESGLAVRLNELLDDTAKTSSGDPGSLVQLAGVKGMASDTQNTLYDRLKSIDARIVTLKNTYEKEKARYWRQFNAMESAISNMNSQSSWLAQQLGG